MSFSEREARLVPTLINVLVAGMCDPSRLRRGRDYARQGAVMDVHVETGLLTGFVQGSRPTPYDIVIHATTATEFDNLTALVPTARDIRFDCSCPDWDNPCKHAIAVMSSFADRVGSDPQLLAIWRGAPDVPASSRTAVVGSRSGRSSKPSPPSAPPKPVVTDEIRAAVDTFLGLDEQFAHRAPRPLPELVDLPPPQADGWDEPWASMLDDSIVHLRDHISSL